MPNSVLLHETRAQALADANIRRDEPTARKVPKKTVCNCGWSAAGLMRYTLTYLCQPQRLNSGHHCHVQQEYTDEDARDQREIAHEHQSADVACPRVEDAPFRRDVFGDFGRPPEVDPPFRSRKLEGWRGKNTSRDKKGAWP